MPEIDEDAAGLTIGRLAPSFEAAVGEGVISSKDFRGGWLLIFTKPDDILPLFKTRTINHVLCKRRTRVIALVPKDRSDAISGGNFLKRYILRNRFTILGDPEGRIEAVFGMRDGVKGAFVVDPKGILRARLCYPLENERDLYEIIRLVDALQAADRNKEGRPETVSWKRRLRIAIRPQTSQ